MEMAGWMAGFNNKYLTVLGVCGTDKAVWVARFQQQIDRSAWSFGEGLRMLDDRVQQ